MNFFLRIDVGEHDFNFFKIFKPILRLKKQMSLLTQPSVLIYPRSQAPPTIFEKLWPSPTGKRLTLKLNKKYGGYL